MEFRYSFSEESSRAYWLQSLVDWSPSFQKKASAYYISKLGNLSPDELGGLGKLRDFLRREDAGYLWLWNLYFDISPVPGELADQWQNIERIFKSKFDLLWQEEQHKLAEWKTFLESDKFSISEKEEKKLAGFFGLKESTPTVYDAGLLIHWDKNLPSGHTHQNFPDKIILPISSVTLAEAGRVRGVMLHEAIHHYAYKSEIFEAALNSAYKKIIRPTGLKIEGQKWKSLITETVITSIAGKRYNNYFGKNFAVTDADREQAIQDGKELEDFNFEKHKKNSGFLIRKAASLMLPMTTEYIDSDKAIDSLYAENVATVWLGMAIQS